MPGQRRPRRFVGQRSSYLARFSLSSRAASSSVVFARPLLRVDLVILTITKQSACGARHCYCRSASVYCGTLVFTRPELCVTTRGTNTSRRVCTGRRAATSREMNTPPTCMRVSSGVRPVECLPPKPVHLVSYMRLALQACGRAASYASLRPPAVWQHAQRCAQRGGVKPFITLTTRRAAELCICA